MATVKILAERELRHVVPLDIVAVQCMEEAFRSLASKAVEMPPVMRLDISEHRGEVDVKTAYMPGFESFAIKISPGFFDNPKIGLPSTSGMMVLLSSRTGQVQALLMDNGYLTNVRTAAAGAVAARHLAREDASTATIFGTGMQARLQLQALMLVRPIREARIWARNHEKAETTARELSKLLGIHVSACVAPAAAVSGAHVIITATPANHPILEAEWLEPGQHITAMGSDAEDKNELEPAVIARADLYVADCLEQTRRLGELHHALAAGVMPDDARVLEIGEIVAEKRVGRTNNAQITVSDLTGTGIQDTAIASLAFARALKAGLGDQLQV